MAEKIITATLHDMTEIPPGSVYQGDGMVEFNCQIEPWNIAGKLAELDVDKKTYFKSERVKVPLAADARVVELEKKGAVEKTTDKPPGKVIKK